VNDSGLYTLPYRLSRRKEKFVEIRFSRPFLPDMYWESVLAGKLHRRNNAHKQKRAGSSCRRVLYYLSISA
ncbi:MAG TPA: hypothetical protein PLC06_16115, partial [Promineifilum sp.]|nr:hypothetical protein [Promineifilum sp.]